MLKLPSIDKLNLLIKKTLIDESWEPKEDHFEVLERAD
jgi:hypothetical protein